MGGDLREQLLTESVLQNGWQRVQSNRGMAGSDGVTVRRFGESLAVQLENLRQEVASECYEPLPLLEVMIPKPGGGERRLAVPAVRDRVLQTAAALLLSPLLEREFEDSSFGYRPGRSVADAIARVARAREQHYRWVVDADIKTFFDEINHRYLLDRLRESLSDHSLLPLIELWLAAILQPESGERYLLVKGVVQGSPISPLLSNLYLDDLDERLAENGFRLVRYADDFLILCRSQAEAEQALALTRYELTLLDLSISEEKTQITHFDEGFTFLGVHFHHDLMEPVDRMAGKWLIPERSEWSLAPEEPLAEPLPSGEVSESEGAEPSDCAIFYAGEGLRGLDSVSGFESVDREELTAAELSSRVRYEENRALSPLLRTVTIQTQGVRLLKEGERMVVAQGQQVVASVPLHRIDQLVVQGNQLISTALLRFAAEQEITVTFTDLNGRPLTGMLDDRGLHLERHRQQFIRDGQMGFKLGVATEWVAVKLHNSRVLLRNLNRRRQLAALEQAISELEKIQSQLVTAKTLNELRGFEGAAAHRYFSALKEVVPEPWHFPGRRKRPPTDPINVLLSYGYGVLHATIYTLVLRQRLHPWLGALHQSNSRHPALVADLMEPFRAILIDSLALQVLPQLTPADFIETGDPKAPCQMNEATRKRWVGWIHNKLRNELTHPITGQRIDYYRLLQWQVWHYGQFVMGVEPQLKGFKSR